METLIPDISHLLNDTLISSLNKPLVVSAAEDQLDQLSRHPDFPLSLLAITRGGDSQGLKIASAVYLKNFIKRNEVEIRASPPQYIEFRNQLAQALLIVDRPVLKVLIEAFRVIITTDFVKENSWPNLVPELKSAIQSSNLISQNPCSQWSTINALTVLQTTIRPFQYFLNPEVPKESVPPQLELIAEDILVPLQATVHFLVDKALSCPDRLEIEYEVLIICKCIYFGVRSYMPSALRLALLTYCNDWYRILDSLRLGTAFSQEGHLWLKIGKRILIILCTLVTRHRKYADKLMPDIIKCAIRIVTQNVDISSLDPLSERIVSLAFDVISHVLETGPGWRSVSPYFSPYFSSLLDSAIFPALTLNRKDVSEWEEDVDEYIRKNLPSDIDDISGWTEDLYTARKSAINLLGVIAHLKGPPSSAASKQKKRTRIKKRECHSTVGELLVIPYLSRFPIPCGAEKSSSKVLQDYYGVLMAYGGLQDFLKERTSEYTYTLIQHRVLPIFSLSPCSPYLLSTANWLLGELACCIPQAMSANIYNSLTKSLTMSDDGYFNYYPIRASATTAITELINNQFFPPDWLPFLQILVNRMAVVDENESSLFFNLLSTVIEAGMDKVVAYIPIVVSSITDVILRNISPGPEPWSQVVERGFTALAQVAQIWESSLPDDIGISENGEWRSGWASIAKLFADLLQKAWLMPSIKSTDDHNHTVFGSLSPSCLHDASTLLAFVMRFVTETDEVTVMKITELLAVWSTLIADWDSWEEMEDQAIFNSIQEAVNLQRKCEVQILFFRGIPLVNSSQGSMLSIFEGICSFVSEAIKSYPSAVWRACSCIHALLHVLSFSSDAGSIKYVMATNFTTVAFSRFRDTHEKPIGLWKPLLLIISSCYILYPEDIEQVLQKEDDNGFIIWASALAHISLSSFTPGLTTASEITISVVSLQKVVERLLISWLDKGEILRVCFVALLDAFTRMKEVPKEDEEEELSDEEESEDNEDNDDEGDDYDEDSEDDQLEETEEEFLDRYAKAAADLQNEIVEGDIEDHELELEFGSVDEMKLEGSMLLLIERHSRDILGGQPLPPSLLQRLIISFPQHSHLFEIS